MTDNALGLRIDMLDVDLLRRFANTLSDTYGDRTWLREFANRLDATVRDIGVLRAKAGLA